MRARLVVVFALALATAAACGDDASTNGAAGDAPPAAPATPPPGAAGDAGADASVVNPNPTVSSWMATNVGTDLARVDVTHQLTGFDAPAGDLDARGYPKANVTATSATDIGFLLPSGTYRIAFKGAGSVTVGGDLGGLTGDWTTVGDERRNEIAITSTPGQFGRFLRVTIANGPGETVTDLRILAPGHDFDTRETFLPELLRALTPFRALRFMDWQATNGSTLVSWGDRPRADHFGKSPHGEPYEHVVELVNVTGKDAWVTIPENVDAAFVTSFASMLAEELDFDRIQPARDRAGYTTPFTLYVEISNETWNQGFSAYATLLAAANADAARYGGPYDGAHGPTWMAGNGDLMKVARVEADRLVTAGEAFRTAFGRIGRASAIAPVLAGWALGPAFSDAGMRFIAAHHGAPKDHVAYVAQAPYFATEDANATSLDALFDALSDEIAEKEETFEAFKALGEEHGVGIIAYEGGQHLTGTTHQAVKHLAQHDVRMYEAYGAYLGLWEKVYGKSLFAHFSLAGTPGVPEFVFQYGYWGALGGIMLDPATCGTGLTRLDGDEELAAVVGRCPKYRALAERVP